MGEIDGLVGIGMKETAVKAPWGPVGKPLSVLRKNLEIDNCSCL